MIGDIILGIGIGFWIGSYVTEHFLKQSSKENCK